MLAVRRRLRKCFWAGFLNPNPSWAATAGMVAALVLSQPPMAIAGEGNGIEPQMDGQVLTSLDLFAFSWMQQLRTQSTQPALETISYSTRRAVLSYREFSSPLTELKATGYAAAPFVGLIRYTERIYACFDSQRQQCVLSSSTPVTEIFRYQNGRWIY